MIKTKTVQTKTVYIICSTHIFEAYKLTWLLKQKDVVSGS